jgi:hypothetical protein
MIISFSLCKEWASLTAYLQTWGHRQIAGSYFLRKRNARFLKYLPVGPNIRFLFLASDDLAASNK